MTEQLIPPLRVALPKVGKRVPDSPKRPALLVILLAVVLLTQSRAQEAPATVPYQATLVATGDSDLDRLLRAASGLIALQSRAPTDAEGILARIGAEPDRLRPALESEGYWAGRASVTAPGRALEASALGAPPSPVALEIRVETGPRYTLRRIETTDGPAVPLAPGGPARAEAVLAAQEAAALALARDARPLARIERQVTVDHAAQAMDVTFTVNPGPQADFAAPTVSGTERVDPEVVRRAATSRLAGLPYSSERLDRARAEVSALGAFSSVRLDAGTALDQAGRLPVTVTVRERPFRALSAAAAYETNYGLALRGAFEHRNLFGGAENLRIELEASRLGNKIDRTNARAAVTYRQPLPFGWDGALVTSLAFLRERLDSYDRDGVTFSALYQRRLSERWTLSTGPVADVGQSGPPGGPLSPYQVAGWTVQGRYDSTDSVLDPRRGIRALGTITPSYAFTQGTPFVALRLGASTYLDLTGEGRTVLALRAGFGSLLNGSASSVPPSQRFYAGGGGSVRGYDFQSIGPRDARGRPQGGASLLEGSIELRQRIGRSLGVVAFIDAGAVGTGAGAPTDAIRAGAGIGARYYTAIGPIRADIAIPLVRQQGSGSFGLYLGIGHAF